MTRQRRTVLFVILTLLTMFPHNGDTGPVRLMTLSERIDSPVRIALDVQGNLYVSDTARKTLLIYNHNGQYQRSLAVPDGPLGLAVDASGKIYIGSEEEKSVKVYNTDLSFSHSIGAGEIGRPNSVAIDSNGRVFVADSTNDMIKVFEPSGLPAFGFGSTGNTDGLFNKPTAVALNDAAGEIYVTDLQISGMSNDRIHGARIQVFDKNGVFKRSFGRFGINAGQIATPVDIAIDKNGTLYVADSLQQVIHLVDPDNGTLLDSLYDQNNPLIRPQGIAIGKNNLVYVTSYAGKSVEVYALDGYVTLSVVPPAVSFTQKQLTPGQVSQSVALSNSGTGIVQWTANPGKPWIQLDRVQGRSGPNSSSTLQIGTNPENLAPGTHTGSVSLQSDFGQVDTVSVSLTVLPAPVLQVSSDRITFNARKGTKPDPKIVSINFQNAAPVAWSLIPDSPWLTITPSSGAAAGTAAFSVDASLMSTGIHTGHAIIHAPGAFGDNSSISVNLNITAPNLINVGSNHPDARFTLVGPITTYTGSGKSWSRDNAPAGEYVITYDPVHGYRKPAMQKMTLVEDGEITFNGKYSSWKELSIKQNILAAKGPGPRHEALVTGYKADGTSAGFELIAFEALSHGANIASADIDGDGTVELITGAGPGPENPAMVRIFKTDGTTLAEFTPFASQYGVAVAAADLNGDGKAEIIVAPGPGPNNPSVVKVFSYPDLKMPVLEFTAFDKLFYGVNVVAADTQGDRFPELVTSPGPGPDNPAEIKIWKLEQSSQTGSWTVTENGHIHLDGGYGVNLAAGDTDGDERDEIIAGSGPDPQAGAEVRVLRADGNEINRFLAFNSYKYGVNVAASDLDGDGAAEIVTGAGPDPEPPSPQPQVQTEKKKRRFLFFKFSRRSEVVTVQPAEQTVKIYKSSGENQYSFTPYVDRAFGVKVVTGSLGL